MFYSLISFNSSKTKYISFAWGLLLTLIMFFALFDFVFPTVAYADDAMPTVISTAITDLFNGVKGVFIIQTINFSSLPRVSITANPCITASGCMSSDNPKYDCRANRWVISINGGMQPVKIPSPYEGAKAILVQIQGLTNVIKEKLPGTPGIEIGIYDPQKGWLDKNQLSEIVNLKIREVVEMSVNFSNNVANAVTAATGGKGGYVDADGEFCGPGIDEITGDRLQPALLKTQDLINTISNTFQTKVIWQVPDKNSTEEVQLALRRLGITVGGNNIPMPPPAPTKSLFYKLNQKNLSTLSNLHLAQSNSDDPKSTLLAAKDFYGYALTARQGTEQAKQYIDARKKEGAKLPSQSFLSKLKLAFNRLISYTKAAEEKVRWSQIGNDFQNWFKIPFVEVDAFNAVRHLATYNVPIFMGLTGNGSDPEVVRGAVIVDYNPSDDSFVIFLNKKGLVKISWNALMGAQPRFLVGIPEK